jgi:transcriptional regulator with XRE-family HTH domain
MYSSKELGMNIKNARRHRSKKSGKEFTVKDLAVKIGETTKWVKRLERGEFYPEWDALNFIADVCGVDIENLIGEKFADEIEYEDAVKGGQVARTISEEELRI